MLNTFYYVKYHLLNIIQIFFLNELKEKVCRYAPFSASHIFSFMLRIHGEKNGVSGS